MIAAKIIACQYFKDLDETDEEKEFATSLTNVPSVQERKRSWQLQTNNQIDVKPLYIFEFICCCFDVFQLM